MIKLKNKTEFKKMLREGGYEAWVIVYKNGTWETTEHFEHTLTLEDCNRDRAYKNKLKENPEVIEVYNMWEAGEGFTRTNNIVKSLEEEINKVA